MSTENPALEIIIADDHQLFADGIISLLSQDPRIKNFKHAANGDILFKMLLKKKPDIILLDIKMPGMNGIEVLKKIKQHYTDIKVIMLSTYSDKKTIEECMNNGADGYLFKNASKQELINTILGKNNEYANLILNNSNIQEYYSSIYKLTKREWEIMLLIKKGMTNIQMSETLTLSIYTIETHRKNLMQKLNLKNSVGLMSFIYEKGI
jgi:DNA-binding NarL/FixJ family response regulator